MALCQEKQIIYNIRGNLNLSIVEFNTFLC